MTAPKFSIPTTDSLVGPALVGGTPVSPSGGEPLAPAPTTRRKRRWWIPVAIIGGFVFGLAAGGGAADPTASTEYTDLSAKLKVAESATGTANDRADAAEATAVKNAAALDTRGKDLDTRSAELDTRQAGLETREGAVTSTEQAIAARQINNGTWTVGTDIEPGTYRTAEAVTSMCYWAILRTGTNGGDIVRTTSPREGSRRSL
ncbi:hypothetical protein [Pengzhenrongella phosphoraccumulans]|uniref:hypothetical protein n=1 Tax=Pengzhenrongella phosphoraccumulans TaxID=3114394 RepID=UPI003890CE1D